MVFLLKSSKKNLEKIVPCFYGVLWREVMAERVITVGVLEKENIRLISKKGGDHEKGNHHFDRVLLNRFSGIDVSNGGRGCGGGGDPAYWEISCLWARISTGHATCIR
jgi:hypothetical protein